MARITEIVNPRSTVQWFSSGLTTNLASGAAYADTGPLAAGEYIFDCYFGTEETAALKLCKIEHRNAADDDYVGSHAAYMPAVATGGLQHMRLQFTMAAGERLRMSNLGGGTLGIRAAGSIQATRIG